MTPVLIEEEKGISLDLVRPLTNTEFQEILENERFVNFFKSVKIARLEDHIIVSSLHLKDDDGSYILNADGIQVLVNIKDIEKHTRNLSNIGELISSIFSDITTSVTDGPIIKEYQNLDISDLIKVSINLPKFAKKCGDYDVEVCSIKFKYHRKGDSEQVNEFWISTSTDEENNLKKTKIGSIGQIDLSNIIE